MHTFTRTIISQIKLKRTSLLIYYLVATVAPLWSQNNLVPNHSFEEVDDCFLEYGDIPSAPPWQIVPEPENSPDLFHYCSTSAFYSPPAGCMMVEPFEGEGMIAQAHNIFAEERVYVRLTDTLPWEKDIYVAFSVIPEAQCSEPPNQLCYSNTQCLAFSDFAFQFLDVVLKPDSVLTNTEEWITLRTCYRSKGTEDFVLLGNYRLGSETRLDCRLIDDLNFSYSYFDEIIVAPFEVVPDTIILCGDETLDIDATFYDLPIAWSDGVQGAIRTIDESGRLIALGDTGRCSLRDTTFVVKIPDEPQTIPLLICDGEDLLLESPVPAIWPNGDTSSTYLITEAGLYEAILLTDCDEKTRTYLYDVTDDSCDITHFVPNVFSPNRDGINDELSFFFKGQFNYSGVLRIFDRWGSLVYEINVDQDTLNPQWDGTFNGKPLASGVYIWAYQYTVGKDEQRKMVSGDVAMLR